MTAERWNPDAIMERVRDRGIAQPAPPFDPAEHERRLAKAEADRIQELEHRVQKDIPTRYRQAQATHPNVLQWAETGYAQGTGLLLLGPSGVGKTWEAFGAYHQVITNGQLATPALVSTVADLLHDARPGNDEDDPIGRARKTFLLILDDIGAQRDSDWTAEVLYRILDYRWAWQLPTILTTNLPVADLRESLGDRLASRLAGQCEFVALTGNDRRRRPA